MTTIRINSKQYHPTATSLTGKEIKELAAGDGVASDFDLFLVHEPGTGKPGDEQIRDDQVIQLQNGMRFRAVPAGNRG